MKINPLKKIKPGIVTGSEAQQIFNYAKEHKFAIPAINITNTNTINTALEAAKEINSPVIIQLSNGGAHFYAGGSLENDKQQASIAGAISAAKHVDTIAKQYGVRVIMHTDHAAKKILPWIDGLIKASEKEYKKTKKAIFTSHMIDLSKETLEDNIKISTKYMKKLHELNMLLEVEIGMTGGEEDGVDNTGVENDKLYTKPEDVERVYLALKKISNNFTIAATFGNLHGVYKLENMKLHPEILNKTQKYIEKKHKTKPKPINFVFHGGSGSPIKDIKKAVRYGVVKLNIDTDAQWALWEGVREYHEQNKKYLKQPIGNPTGKDAPNKKYYDPRKWLRAGEENLKKRLKQYFKDLNAQNKN